MMKRHAPTVDASVTGSDVQLHAPQLLGSRDAQQQPPRHVFVPQSKSEPHASPGSPFAHAPLPGEHAAHGSCRAVVEQQNPPRQTDEVIGMSSAPNPRSQEYSGSVQSLSHLHELPGVPLLPWPSVASAKVGVGTQSRCDLAPGKIVSAEIKQ